MDKIKLDTEYALSRPTRILDMFFERANQYVALPWLDVGSGDSPNRHKMLERLHQITPSGEIAVSEADLDVRPYGFPDDTFRTVTSWEVLEHLYNPLFHLHQVWKVMKPGGFLFMSTPNDYGLIYKAEHLLSRKYRPHFHQFSERDLRDIMERAKFKVVELKKFRRSKTGTLARVSRNGLFLLARKP